MDGRPIAQGLYLKLVAALGTDDFVTSNPTVRKPDPALSGWLTHPATVAHALTVGQQQGEAA